MAYIISGSFGPGHHEIPIQEPARLGSSAPRNPLHAEAPCEWRISHNGIREISSAASDAVSEAELLQPEEVDPRCTAAPRQDPLFQACPNRYHLREQHGVRRASEKCPEES